MKAARLRRSVFRSLVAAWAAAALTTIGAVAVSASSPFTQSGTLGLSTATMFATDHHAHRVIAIHGDSGVPLAISSLDENTLRARSETTFKKYFNQGVASGRPAVFAFDEHARRLYMVAYHSLAEQISFANPQLLTIDVDRMTTSERLLAPVLPHGVRPLGMTLEPDGRLLVAGQLQPGVVLADVPKVSGVIVAEIDPAQAGPGNAGPKVTWGPEPVRGCQALITTQSQTVVARLGDDLFVGCATSTAIFVPLPGVPTVVAVPMSSPANVSIAFLPGSYALGDIAFDSSGRRLLLIGSAPNRPAQAVWIFDLPRRLFLGQIAAGDLNLECAGVDPGTGRLYVGTSGKDAHDAILVGSDRGLEIAQAVSFAAHPVLGVITPVPASHLVIIPIARKDGGTQYGVFRDELPASAIQPGAPVDFSAIDSTATDTPQFAGDVQAFGLRVHELGGVNGVGQNVFPETNVNYGTQTTGRGGLNDGDRDFAFARVGDAHLSEGDASARAVESQADDNTDHDYRKARGSNLSKAEASCINFGGAPESSTQPGAGASCSQAKGHAGAATHAEQATVSVPGMPAPIVTVGSTLSTATLDRVGSGVAVLGHAEARDVAIDGGVVTIGRVVSEAFARATGRAGGAGASFAESFENVSVAGPSGAPSFSCTTSCDPTAVLAAMSAALGTQFRIETPGVCAGAGAECGVQRVQTPGGAHAHAFRDPWEHQQDIVVNNQPVTELQVPALRITYIADNAAASRVIVELAASKADATSYPIGVVSKPQPSQSPEPVVGVHVHVKVLGEKQTGTQSRRPGVRQRIVSTIERLAGHGWEMFAPKTAASMARAALLWVLLLTPVVLAARRRELSGVRRLKP